MKDNEKTWVLTKRKYSIFTWGFWKYKNTTANSENCLPEFDIQDGFIKFAGFYKRLGSISIYSTFNFYFVSICPREEMRTFKTVDFAPEAEDEVIRESVSHKLDRPLVIPSKKVLIYSPQTKTSNSIFHIGDSLRFGVDAKYPL